MRVPSDVARDFRQTPSLFHVEFDSAKIEFGILLVINRIIQLVEVDYDGSIDAQC